MNGGTFIGKIIDKLNLKELEIKKPILNINEKEEKNNNSLIGEEIESNNTNKSEILANNELNFDKLNIPPNFMEEMPNFSQDFAKNILKMSGLEGINPQFLVEMYKSPLIINMVKNMYSNPKLLSEYSKLPQVQQLSEKNPFIKLTLENPQLVNQSLTPSNINFISHMLSGAGNAGNNKMNNNISEYENKKEKFNLDLKEKPNNSNIIINKESDIKEEKINESDNQYKDFLIKLAKMGFTDNNLNLELLKECNGNYEKTLDLLFELK